MPIPLGPVINITSPFVAVKLMLDKIVLFPTEQFKEFNVIELSCLSFLTSIDSNFSGL